MTFSKRRSIDHDQGSTKADGEEQHIKREFMLGVNCVDVRNGIQFLSEDEVVYISGNTIVIEQYKTRTQRFIPASRNCSDISFLAVNPQKKLIAVAEKAGLEWAVAHIYDSSTLKKRKALVPTSKNIQLRDILSLSFSADSKHFLVLGGGPDYNCVCWNIVKVSNIVATLSLATPSGKSVSQTSFSPTDPVLFCATGNGILRFFRLVDNAVRCIRTNIKAEAQDYTCQNWLSDGSIAIGTSSGSILVISGFEVKHTIQPSTDRPEIVTSIIGTKQCGLVVGFDSGVIRLYETMGSGRGDSYKLARNYTNGNIRECVMTMDALPSGEFFACGTANCQTYLVPLSGASVLDDEEFQFREFLVPFHRPVSPTTTSIIIGMDVCVCKPLLATFGADHRVCIWNYKTKTMDLSERFMEAPVSVSLHPNSFRIIIGFSAKISICEILVDRFDTLFEIQSENLQMLSFSNGGHVFAVACDQVMKIYDSYTFKLIQSMRGSSSPLVSLRWEHNDTRVCCITSDGSTLVWDAVTGTKISVEVPDTPVSCCNDGTISPDLLQVYLVDDGLIRVIEAREEVFLKNPYSENDDGSLAVFTVCRRMKLQRERAALPRLPLSIEEVLVSREYLDERLDQLGELRREYESKMKIADSNLRIMNKKHEKNMVDINDEYKAKLSDAGRNYDRLLVSKRQEKKKFEQQIQNLKMNHDTEIDKLHKIYAQKLISEEERGHHLQNESEQELTVWKQESQQLTNNHSVIIQQTTDEFNNRIESEHDNQRRLKIEMKRIRSNFTNLNIMLEEDGDEEYERERQIYKKRLAADKKSSKILKEESEIIRSKYDALVKDSNDLFDTISRSRDKENELHKTIRTMKNELDSLGVRIRTREAAVTAKVEMIRSVETKNRELERSKFMLDDTIQDLKVRLEPSELDAASLRKLLVQRDVELNESHRQNDELSLTETKLHCKFNGIVAELKGQERSIESKQESLERLVRGVNGASSKVEDHKDLKESIISLYRTHANIQKGKYPRVNKAQKGDNNGRVDGNLKKKILKARKIGEKDNTSHEIDYTRLIKQNVLLTRELNDLRRRQGKVEHPFQSLNIDNSYNVARCPLGNDFAVLSGIVNDAKDFLSGALQLTLQHQNDLISKLEKEAKFLGKRAKYDSHFIVLFQMLVVPGGAGVVVDYQAPTLV
eukprot:CAMPEP_0116018788 /NCGR_PEP_ID=MMETSP0321-20121206/8853_1 /TAXON_ID=163516 /ORGANISM="Leptocylindrus danicus var. danicus, Strain B650" /LENGTH=1176 /DNA_ID=CAMNT_0003489241 /DNA_START=260 /DNA_END=3792 /DNA_ORIENTATION=-